MELAVRSTTITQNCVIQLESNIETWDFIA